MDGGPDFYGVTKDAAQVVGGAATATGGYLYFTKTLGWVRLTVGAGTTFMGGMIGYGTIHRLTGIEDGVCAGLAATATLGVIYAVRAATGKLEVLDWFGRKSA